VTSPTGRPAPAFGLSGDFCRFTYTIRSPHVARMRAGSWSGVNASVLNGLAAALRHAQAVTGVLTD
jgi:hypothetical protein